MSNFNVKIKVRKPKKQQQTLDFFHNEKMLEFEKEKKNLNKYKKKLELIENKLSHYLNIDHKKITEEEMDEKFELIKNINELKDTIKLIEEDKKEEDYFLNVGEVLYEYYDKSEKNEVDTNIINFFDFKNKNKINNSYSSEKAKLLDEYLSKLDNKYKKTPIHNIEYCTQCNGQLILNYIEGINICKCCGEQYFILIDSDKPNYKEPNNESTYFAYKRINHYNEWLSQFQAKESTDISGDIIERILCELKKERYYNVADISNNKIKDILKKLKLNKYYEHIPYIINKINGKPPPILTPEVEESLRNMFKEIQGPFIKHCPKDRKNFLSYSYVLHKFIQLLGLDEYLVNFPLLKSREKLYQQDKIWKMICQELNWEFIKSI